MATIGGGHMIVVERRKIGNLDRRELSIEIEIP